MVRMHKRFWAFALAAAMLAALSGCGGAEKAAAADLQAVYNEIGALPELPEMIVLEEKRIDSYYGIDAAACPQIHMAVSGDGLRVDEIWLIEAGSDEDADAIETNAQSRIERLCAETENYLPDQYAVAKEGKVLRQGRCVALFISPEAEAMAEIFEKAFA